MGFLDRVKTSFNQTVGGKTSIRLDVRPETAHRGDVLDYRLVLATNGPLKAERITIGLYGRERVRIWVGAPPAGGTGAAVARADGSPTALESAHETLTFEQVATVVAEELALPAGQSREFTGRLPVPADIQPTYRGVDAQHTWVVRAVVASPLGDDVVEEREIIVR